MEEGYFCYVRYFLILSISVLIVLGCTEHQKTDQKTVGLEARILDSTSTLRRPCSCSDTVDYSFSRLGIGFQNIPPGSTLGAISNYEHIPSDDEILLRYSEDSIRLTIKSLSFSNWDTIPEKFGIFENVEIIETSTAQGLGLFPKLKEVRFWLSPNIKIDSNAKWLRRVEVLRMGKVVIKGLGTFKSLHNLKVMSGNFVHFEEFPKGLDSLTCLQKISISPVTTRKKIDLSEIDFSQITCLQEVRLDEGNSKSLFSLPRGLDKKDLKVNISHANLTKEEKRILKSYKVK